MIKRIAILIALLLTACRPPTQAEVQALRHKAEELADDVRALSALVHVLRGVGCGGVREGGCVGECGHGDGANDMRGAFCLRAGADGGAAAAGAQCKTLELSGLFWRLFPWKQKPSEHGLRSLLPRLVRVQVS